MPAFAILRYHLTSRLEQLAVVLGCCVPVCNDCTELLALHTYSLPLFLVSAAISIIVLFVATLRLWPVLETRDDLADDNGQNRPLARGMGDAGRLLVR